MIGACYLPSLLLAQRENVRSDLNRNVQSIGFVYTGRWGRGDDPDERNGSGQAARIGAGGARRDDADVCSLVRARVVLAGAVGVYRLCHDLPMALYSDRHGVFRTQTKYFSQEFAILDFITRV